MFSRGIPCPSRWPGLSTEPGSKLETRLFRRGRESRQITDNSIFVLEEEMSMCSIFPKEILDLAIHLIIRNQSSTSAAEQGSASTISWAKEIAVRGLEGSDLGDLRRRVMATTSGSTT